MTLANPSRSNKAAFRPVAVALVLLAACSSGKLAWTEDVRLPDGRVLTLQRWAEFGGGSGHLGDPSIESQQGLEFKHPDTGEVVRWRTRRGTGEFRMSIDTPVPATFDDGPDGIAPGFLNTIAIWIDDGKPTLLGKPAYGDDMWRFHCPNPPYLLYEWAAGRWRSKPLNQIGIKGIRANLTTSPLNDRERIVQAHRKLDVAETSASYTYRDGIARHPYVLTFEQMPQQTFDVQDCVRPDRLKKLLVEEK